MSPCTSANIQTKSARDWYGCSSKHGGDSLPTDTNKQKCEGQGKCRADRRSHLQLKINKGLPLQTNLAESKSVFSFRAHSFLFHFSFEWKLIRLQGSKSHSLQKDFLAVIRSSKYPNHITEASPHWCYFVGQALIRGHIYVCGEASAWWNCLGRTAKPQTLPDSDARLFSWRRSIRCFASMCSDSAGFLQIWIGECLLSSVEGYERHHLFHKPCTLTKHTRNPPISGNWL